MEISNLKLISAFCCTLIAVIVFWIPASNAAHIDCTWDTYIDRGTGRCELCSDLCLPARGMMEECRRSCKDYLQGKAAGAEPGGGNKAEAKNEPEGRLPGWGTAVLVVVALVVLLVISAILFGIYKYKRRNLLPADQDTSVMQPMDPAGNQPEEEDRPCRQDTSVMKPILTGIQPEEKEGPCRTVTSKTTT